MKFKLFIFLFLSVVLISGCTESEPVVNEQTEEPETEDTEIQDPDIEALKNTGREDVNAIVAVYDESDSLVVKCKEELDTCKETKQQKSDMSLAVVEIEKFEDTLDAWDFYEEKRKPSQESISSHISASSNVAGTQPIILSYVKEFVKPESWKEMWPDKEKQPTIPYVLICDSEGKLVSKSKSTINCN